MGAEVRVLLWETVESAAEDPESRAGYYCAAVNSPPSTARENLSIQTLAATGANRNTSTPMIAIATLANYPAAECGGSITTTLEHPQQHSFPHLRLAFHSAHHGHNLNPIKHLSFMSSDLLASTSAALHPLPSLTTIASTSELPPHILNRSRRVQSCNRRVHDAPRTLLYRDESFTWRSARSEAGRGAVWCFLSWGVGIEGGSCGRNIDPVQVQPVTCGEQENAHLRFVRSFVLFLHFFCFVNAYTTYCTTANQRTLTMPIHPSIRVPPIHTSYLYLF
jgi:hypothetical protein